VVNPVFTSTPDSLPPPFFVTSKPLVSNRTDKRTKRNLMLLGSAAVLAVYGAGFFHTAAAAAKQLAEEQDRAGASGRGGNRESGRPEADPTPARPVAPATAVAVANLPVAVPATPPPPAAASPLQTPAPAPLAAPVTSPVVTAPAVAATPAPAVATATSAAPAQTTPAPAPVPASVPNPVPATPVQVAALPAAPVMATSNAGTAAPVAATVTRKYKDGAYFGWGRCRHGELKVIVELKDDKIISAEIPECYTRYSKNVISRLPKQLVDRQSPDKLDRISGASDSSDAYYYAVVEALKAAKL
jgi:uncharacterized protein with FMN-binding domain